MISLVIPVYNEEKNVVIIHKELVDVLRLSREPFEIIFVNDGSTDKTLDMLMTLKPVKIINFQKRFGQTAAFDAGFKAAKGDTVVSLDGDLQSDPRDIPRLLETLREGYDAVCGWRMERKDVFMKRLGSWGARMMRKFFLGDSLHDAGCSLRVYRRKALESLDIYGEMHRMIVPILVLRGFLVTELPVNHRARIHGTTKYNWKRAIKGFVDIINIWFLYKYRARPLHLFGGLGLCIGSIGGALTMFFFVERVFFNIPLGGRTLPIASLFLILFSIQLFVTGLLADMIVKNYYSVSREHSYFIKNIIENR